MNFQDFYSSFEEKYKEDFSKIFQPDEELRLKMLKDFRKSAALRFIPTILLIASIMAIMYMYSVSFFIGIFSIINIFLLIWCAILFHNVYINFSIFVVPLMQIKSTGIVLAIVIPLIVFIKLFYNYKDKWNKKYTSLIKSKYMNKLIGHFGNIKWQKNTIRMNLKESTTEFIKRIKQKRYMSYIPFDTLKKSGLFIDFAIREVDDEFKGEYNEVPFEISETVLYSNEDSGGVRGDGSRNSKSKIFQGIVIDFKINKTVKNRTLVSTKYNKISKNSAVIEWISLFIIGFVVWNMWGIFGKIIISVIGLFFLYLAIFQKNKKFQKVLLEDEKFNKIFNAYSSDQIEARYLLTTSFMDRFKNLQSTFGAKVIKCSFYDENKLMIAISTNKNLFEIGSLFKSVYDKDFMKQFYKELSSIYFLIDYFKLDENTGL